MCAQGACVHFFKFLFVRVRMWEHASQPMIKWQSCSVSVAQIWSKLIKSKLIQSLICALFPLGPSVRMLINSLK